MKCPLCSAGEGRPYARTQDARAYWNCGNCALIWLDEAERLSLPEEKTHYYTHENFGADYLNYLGKTALPIAALLAPGAKGLDFGCGPTEGMKELLSPLGFSVDSYDPIFFPHASLLKNRYAFLLCSEVAEHFFYPEKEFATMNELMHPGAYIAISSRLWCEGSNFDQWFYRRDPTHVVFYRRPTVEWIAHRFDWDLLRLESPLWILRKQG
jgi:hypothetical protein